MGSLLPFSHLIIGKVGNQRLEAEELAEEYLFCFMRAPACSSVRKAAYWALVNASDCIKMCSFLSDRHTSKGGTVKTFDPVFPSLPLCLHTLRMLS